MDEHRSGLTDFYRAEFRMRNKRGGWQWVLSRGKVVEWTEDGVPARIIGTHTDIHQRKAAEEQGYEEVAGKYRVVFSEGVEQVLRGETD